MPLKHAGEAREMRLQPVLLGVLARGVLEVADHLVDVVLQRGYFAARLDRDRAREVALGHGGGHFRNGSYLRGEVGRQAVHVVGQVLPQARSARHPRLAAELAFAADLARYVGDLLREHGKRVDHAVDGLGKRRHFPLRLDRKFAVQVAVRHRGHHVGDAAHLAGQVRRHRVDVVGQVLPHAADALDLRLAAELALGADFLRHARHLAGEGVQLVDHGVDGRLQLEHLALHVDGDLFRKVAARDRGGDVGDVPHLAGEVRRHRVHVVGEVLPHAADAYDLGLAAKPALGAHFLRHARDLAGEPVELVDHGVDGRLELQDLAAHVDRDLLGEVAAGYGGGDLGDVPHLAGEVRRHRIHVVGEVLPDPGDAPHLRLAAELAFAPDLARDAQDLARERVQLVDHGVEGAFQLEDLAAHVDRDLLGEVAARHGGGDLGDVPDLAGEVRRHRVHVVGEVLPDPGDALHLCLAAELAFAPDLARDARNFARERVQLVNHRIDGAFQLEDLALDVDGDLLRQIPLGDGGRHLGDVSHLAGEVRRHRVHVVGEVLPHAGDLGDARLTAELAFGPDFPRNARDFARERVQLAHHGVDHGAQAQRLAAQRPAVGLEHHRLRKIALRDRADHPRHLGHRVHHVAQEHVHGLDHLGPSAGGAGHVHALADLAFPHDLVGNAGDFRRLRLLELDHVVEGLSDLAVDASQVERHAHGEVAALERTQRFKELAPVEHHVKAGLDRFHKRFF